MAVNRQKLKLLYLMRMLQEETDSEQGLTMTQILERLEEEGVMAERKSVYRDIEALREFGLDIRTYQRSPVEYALENRDFALPELLLLVDAVQSSRFLTQRKSDALVRSVKQLASARQRALLDKRLHVEGRIKSQNESVFHNVDRIQEALARRRKITFLYFQYDAAKKKILQHDGAFYTETPVQLIYADGFYYLVAYNEKHGALAHYRVDRMDKIEVTDQPACRNELVAGFDARDLESHAFGMYAGEPVSVDASGGGRRHGRRGRPVRARRAVGADGRRRGARAGDGHEKPRVLRMAGAVRRPRAHPEAAAARPGVHRLPSKDRQRVRARAFGRGRHCTPELTMRSEPPSSSSATRARILPSASRSNSMPRSCRPIA